MKKWLFIIGTAAGLTGCSSSYFTSAGYGNDDLYAIHDKAEIARRQQAEAERKKAEAEARKAEWEARLAEAEAEAVQRRYYEKTSNPYEDVLADTYESAYARRLRGFESPTYRMPSSYYDFRYGSSFHYVSAYDPAFYNVMVMGDQVWVEPKYITAMFGTWGRPSVYMDPWYYGWNWRPYFSWGFSFGSWGWSFGPWYDPWYYPGWGPGWGWGHPHWGGHGHPHRPYASNIVHRADPYAPPSSGNRYYGRDQRFNSYGTGGAPNRGTGRHFGVRNPSSGSQSARPGSPSNRSSNRNNYSNPSYRNNSGGNTYNRGGSTNNNSGSSYNRGNNNSTPSYNSGSYNRGGSTGGSYNRGGGSGSSRNAGGR